MKQLIDLWEDSTARTEKLLDDLWTGYSEEPQALVFEAMRYSLLAGGKRLRPMMVRAFCTAAGGSPEMADHAALAIEMIHTYSLIHDDLPAMDNDDYRRGRLTNHKVYGDAMAILAGDGLLTDAFRVLSMAPIAADRIAACIQCLSLCAGPYGMVGGQVLDMEAEHRACTEQEVLDIQSRKTGGLFRASCEMGVICAGGTDAQREAARIYADAIGLAFQIRDDILDATGDAKKLGKAVGVDENKNTFVKLYGLKRSEEIVEEQTRIGIHAVECFDNYEILKNLALFLVHRDH